MRAQDGTRAMIENTKQRLETYALVGGVYIVRVDIFQQITKIVQMVAALCNLNLSKHPIRR